VRVYEVLGTSLQNPHLQERLVAQIIYTLINLPNAKPFYKKKIRGYLPLALNHPNIAPMDYLNLLSGYLKSGFWLSTEYSHHLVKPEGNNFSNEDILTAIGATIPSLRECLTEDGVQDGGIDFFLTQFFTVFSQLVNVNDTQILTGLEQLINKCAPLRIRKLNMPREVVLVPTLDPQWGGSFLKIKNIFLAKFNKLPYEPNPYGGLR
jgi:hypothetical protein